MDFIEQFRTAMAQQGIICECNIIADGKLHRFHVEGDSTDSINGWYVLHTNELPAGAYGCWKRSISESWCLKSKDQMTLFERKTYHSRMLEIKENAYAAKAEAQAKAKTIAKAKWDQAKPASSNHPYLLKKGISPGLLRVEESTNTLLVPVCGPDKQIHSLQQVSPDGTKRFLADGATKGHYCAIGKLKNPTDILFVGEGYATVSTAHHATGLAAACAFYSGNLLAVGQTLREKFPDAELIFIADNDQWSDDGINIGLKKATEAAQALNAKVLYPDFSGLDTRDKPTDFNDLARLAGLDEVKRQLELPHVAPPPESLEPILHTKPIINENAFFGVLRNFVDASRSNSEASAIAVAANVLARFCAMIDRKVYQHIGDSIIHCRPFFILIGNSGKARKGTSEYLSERVFEIAENMLASKYPAHATLRLHGGGLSSGEGIAYAIRDTSDDSNSDDMGVSDKRLLVIEPEFANVLAQCKRETSILSPTIRNLFDGKTLAPLTKTNRIKASNPHVVIIGHITQLELNAKSTIVEASNGFLNRFLICWIERDQLVPFPEKTSEQILDALANAIISIFEFIDSEASLSNGQVEISFTEEAQAFWTAIYPTLTEDRDDIVGALMARKEMYARMLAMIFCVLDKRTKISVNHIEAALSWVDYVEASVEHVFRNAAQEKKQTEARHLADRILSLLSNQGSMSKAEINKGLGKHVPAEKINEALKILETETCEVVRRKEETGGRAREIIELRSAD